MRLMIRTQTAPAGSYTGAKCPACPVIVQPLTLDSGGVGTLLAGLQAHWVACHPEQPPVSRE